MTANPEGLDAALTRVFEERRHWRAERASTAFRTLRPYERRIAREAAVMGYVLGERAGRVSASGIREQLGQQEPPFPSDSTILQQVIEHCDSTSDRFPFLAAACNGKRRRITKAQLYDFERTTNATPSEATA